MTLAQSLIVYFISPVLGVIIFMIVVQIIMSWLIQFNVINIRNQLVSTIYYMLSRFVVPILAPIQRILPSFGGLDLSPIVAILVLQWVQGFVLPKLYIALG
jgi:YggT family protein